mmetsp:Transcript_32877/g.57443  ORF Transcript_32877/g.57443 Transcript_32877/m.57443 type:complete len:197 (+) Transcript_32877:42-632(+)
MSCPDTLCCKLCLELFRNPVVLTSCRDVFCSECYDKLKRSEAKFCPVCRRELAQTAEPAVYLKGALAGMYREPPSKAEAVHGNAVTPNAILKFQAQRIKQYKPPTPSNSDRKIELKLEPDYSLGIQDFPELPYLRLPESVSVEFLLSAMPDILSLAPSTLLVIDRSGLKQALPHEMLLKDIPGYWSGEEESVVYYK